MGRKITLLLSTIILVIISTSSYFYISHLEQQIAVLQKEAKALRQSVIKQEHLTSHAYYLKHTQAVGYTLQIKELENELNTTHDLYQENIKELESLSKDEISRREGMTKAIYAGCLYNIPDPVYCGQVAYGFYNREGWQEVDERAIQWGDLWPLILGVRGG